MTATVPMMNGAALFAFDENGGDDGKGAFVPVKIIGNAASTHPLPTISTGYTGNKTFTTGGSAIPINPDVNEVVLTNKDALNFGTFAFGSTIAEALINAATGQELLPMAAATNVGAILKLGVGEGDNYLAGIANTADIITNVQQKV